MNTLDSISSMKLVVKEVCHNEALNEKFRMYSNVNRNLYNQAIYCVRKGLKEENSKWIRYANLDKDAKEWTNLESDKSNYRMMPKAQVAQQTLRQVDDVFKSFFKSIKDWKKNKDKYSGMPRLPRYMSKTELYRPLIYTNQCSKLVQIGDRVKLVLAPRNKKQNIPEFSYLFSKNQSKVLLDRTPNLKFNQVRIIPLNKKDPKTKFKFEVVYTTTIDQYCGKLKGIILDKENFASCDIGINNFATIVSNKTRPFIISGKTLKSQSKWYEKNLAKAKSKLPFKQRKDKRNKKVQRVQLSSSRRTVSMQNRQARRTRDFAFKCAASIVKYCIVNNIGTFVVGYNQGIKTSPNLSKQVGQTMSDIPWGKFIDRLKFVCPLYGIDLKVTEESYTSKCDGLAFEDVKKHESYLGHRVQRGVFKSSTGVTLNADVNGAFNILRKVIQDSAIKQKMDRRLLYQPVRHSSVNELGCILNQQLCI